MNYGISVLFRAIPLLMALFCFGYGWIGICSCMTRQPLRAVLWLVRSYFLWV